jgi:hypothetical protein
MGGSSPDMPDPAKRPERIVEVEAEDIEIGTSDMTEGTDLRTQGKRALTKPSGGSPTSGIKI